MRSLGRARGHPWMRPPKLLRSVYVRFDLRQAFHGLAQAVRSADLASGEDRGRLARDKAGVLLRQILESQDSKSY